MLGGTVALLGHIAGVTERYTKDNRRFLRVDLALVGGQVETMVWPEALEKTGELWQTGSIARVTGRLQIRGDDYSLTCYDAAEYRLPESASSAGAPADTLAESPAADVPAAPASSPAPPRSAGSANGSAVAAPAPSAGANGNGYANGNGNGGGNGQYSGMLIKMSETDDAEDDRYRLRQAIRVMLEYTGDDKIYLELFLKEGRRVLMEVPTVSTYACDDLRQRLEDFLGVGQAECRR